MRFLVALLTLLTVSAAPAAAATTVYATGVFTQSGVTTNASDALGASNGSFAQVGGAFSIFGLTFGQAGQVVYSFADALSGVGLQLTGIGGAPGISSVFVSIGEIVGGVAVYSAEANFTGGAGVFSFDFSTQCSAISSTGCSLVRVRTLGGFGRGPFRLDGVSGVGAAPEPSSWALMLLGFAGAAFGLKRRRGDEALTLA
ncbi:MAG: PEP-CTERM sorting domain-containing protein [Parvularculaceae bacterium]|nr:PEP-CTERM sorting domain-containing protein [Parvularculaceae bacterium]